MKATGGKVKELGEFLYSDLPYDRPLEIGTEAISIDDPAGARVIRYWTGSDWRTYGGLLGTGPHPEMQSAAAGAREGDTWDVTTGALQGTYRYLSGAWQEFPAKPASMQAFSIGNILGPGDVSYAGANEFIGGTFRGPSHKVITGPVGESRFLFVNFGTDDLPGPSIITFGSAAEIGSNQATSTKYPLRIIGRDTSVLDPGGQIWCDPTTIPLAAGDELLFRTSLTVPNLGVGFRSTFACSPGLGEGGIYASSDPPDYRLTGTIPTLPGYPGWGPVAGEGMIQFRVPVLAIEGDSIPTGTGDSPLGDPPDQIYTSFYRGGPVVRGIAGRMGMIQVSKGGQTAQAIASSSRFRAPALFRLATDYALLAGVNDLAARTVAQLQADIITIGRRRAAMGLRCHNFTLPPPSTGDFSTPGGQTPAAYHVTKSIPFYAWQLDGMPVDPVTFAPLAPGSAFAIRVSQYGHPYVSVIDLRRELESAPGSGVWKGGYTIDGVHPNKTGAIAGGQCLADLSRFGVYS